MTTPTPTTGAGTATRYDRRMYAIMNRGEAASLHATAGRRRAWVVAHTVLTAAFVAAWLGTVLGAEPGGPVWTAVALLAVLVPWCVAMGVINGATRGLFELRGRMLDERQLAERDRSLALAHRITSGTLLAAAAAAGLANWLGGVRFPDLLFPVLLTALVVHRMMPRWIACLRVQDEPGEE
ncbi:hypothetical protein [Streptomyces sp. NPDC047928]|uniref:hypothetical protein n=1 Tax=unclassified Streptomyces TaxID=2593676 RepID=UPI003723F631